MKLGSEAVMHLGIITGPPDEPEPSYSKCDQCGREEEDRDIAAWIETGEWTWRDWQLDDAGGLTCDSCLE